MAWVDRCDVWAEMLALGGLLEPLAHPKPGAVTRCQGRGELDIGLFTLASVPLRLALKASCRVGCRGGCMARGFQVYLSTAERLGISTNVNVGTLLLMLPLACTRGASPEDHARAASRCARDLPGEDASWYYRVLERFRPSHLGKYEGRAPSVGEGRPGSMYEVLRAASWDHVHRELLHGYPLTLEALGLLERFGPGEEGVVRVVLVLLARHGDTLIARKYGWRAYLRSMAEARVALSIVERGVPPVEAVAWLDGEWRRRGWSPGAVLDIVAAALGLYYLHG